MVEQTFPLEQQVIELVATYEAAMDRLSQREKILDNQFEAHEKFLNAQIEKVNSLMADLHETITETGIARWKLSAQEALKLGDVQLQALRKLTEETKNLMSESCSRFERTSQTTVKHIHDAVDHFKLDDFKQYIEKSYEGVKKISSSAIEKIADVLRGFQWKNLALALALSIVAGVIMGLYIDDEWPWELHSTVVKQRTAGEALMNAWPYLSKTDQQYLENKMRRGNK
jgi:hypothetical protein